MSAPTGNVSLTGRPSPYDIKFILNIAVFISQTGANVQDYCTLTQFNIADVNGNGQVLSMDATLLAQYLKYLYNRGTMTVEEWIAADKPKRDT